MASDQWKKCVKNEVDQCSDNNSKRQIQIAPSIDFKRHVRLVSDEKEYEPEYILKKMRKHKLNNMRYKPALY
jgi:hypothetical protein